MMDKVRFDYVAVNQALAAGSYMPIVPLTVRLDNKSITTTGLLDTGATVNVLPYEIGEALGAVWSEQQSSLHLSGNLANWKAKALLVQAQLAHFDEVQLAFAWTQSRNVPMILGQVNFFMAFDVCFYRAELAFDIKRHDVKV
ncbi:MAG: hypothetical protein R6X32_14490 [Chloroflexota bacterium]